MRDEQLFALSIVERYFDTDLQDQASAMDVLLDNGVDHGVASQLVQDLLPSEDDLEN